MSTTTAERLQALRIAAGMTKADVARRAGVSRETVASAERGEIGMRVATLRALLEVLGVPEGEWGEYLADSAP